MKVILKIELEFENWFEDERSPKSNEDWTNFFNNNLMSESSILGVDDGEHQDMIAINSYNIECVNVS